ncbi:unnamed protein product, partial [Tilletia caries]
NSIVGRAMDPEGREMKAVRLMSTSLEATWAETRFASTAPAMLV